MSNNSMKEFVKKMRQDEVAVKLAKEYLILAAREGQIEFVKLFLLCIQNDNIPYEALSCSCRNGHTEVVDLMVIAK